MAPKQQRIQVSSSRGRQPKSVFTNTYEALTSPENASVVRSIAVFGVSTDLPVVVICCGSVRG